MSQLITEFTSSPLLLSKSAQQEVELLLTRTLQHQNSNHTIGEPVFRVQHSKMIAADRVSSDDPFEDYEENSIVIIPIIGIMTKYTTIDWDEWRYVIGMDIIASIINKANISPKISGTILLINTPGGSTQSIYQLEIALRNRTKPCIAVIDGMCMSGGIYVASFCDEIYAVHPMCEVGNIGTFATVVDKTKMNEKFGIKINSVYPPESKYKNLAVREAVDDKPERLIDEQLSPFAKHFQNIITTNRPKLDTSVEGIIEGADFYAHDAVRYNLIDGIMTLEQALEQINRLITEQNIIYSSFKN